MRLLINALSVTNPSGAQVLRGHLQQATMNLSDRIQFFVLVRPDDQTLFRGMDDRLCWINAPPGTRHWLARTLWERFFLTRLIRREQIDAYFTPSGIAASRIGIPQVVFCQNPWAFIPAAQRYRDRFKAWLQRRAYIRSMQTAEAMAFNSHYMQSAYRRAAGHCEREGIIAAQAPDADTLKRAFVLPLEKRRPGQLICVSVMAPHKNVETVLKAVHQLKIDQVHPLQMDLVGSWPNDAYRRKIDQLIKDLNLTEIVGIAGYVSREELETAYAQARVFVLMSRCESFGIPSIEAQAFGTPVISSNVCAIPEVCGQGGIYFDPDDCDGVAAALKRLLTDDAHWQEQSDRAQTNAAQYRWDNVSRPLVELLEGLCMTSRQVIDKVGPE